MPADGGAVALRVGTQDPHGSSGRRGQTLEDLERGGLAGAVDTEEREDPPGVDLEGDAPDGGEVAVAADQAGHLDGRRGHPLREPGVDVDQVHGGLLGSGAPSGRRRPVRSDASLTLPPLPARHMCRRARPSGRPAPGHPCALSGGAHAVLMPRG